MLTKESIAYYTENYLRNRDDAKDWRASPQLAASHAGLPPAFILTAGFDAHREDDLGQMGLVEQDYAWITQRMKDIAQKYAKGRIVSCLEGGYNLSALARSVEAHLRVLADV